MSGSETVAISPGSVLASRYLVERELGAGGMATVLQVKDLRTDRVLALKVLKPEVAAHPEAVERFRREGEFLSSLKHPALIAVEAIGTLGDGRLFLAMELLTGETLGERIRRGRLTPVEISPILAGAAVGLDAAHKAGVVHRDLKPDNIFLSTPRPGGPVQVKLLDFGISKIDGRASLTRTGQVLGTPRYMAPEQLRGEDDLDARIDVYALGVILYEVLAGTPAFPSTQPSDLIVSILHSRYAPLRAVRPDVPAELEAVVARAMSKSRQARFASAIELAQAWFDVVHRDDGPQQVRTGVATNVLGSLIDSMRPPPGLGADALRPATFREFEARLAANPNATRPIDSLGGPLDAARVPLSAPSHPGPHGALAGLASNPAMASPDRTTPAHAVDAVPYVPSGRPAGPAAASRAQVGEMPVYRPLPLASLVPDEEPRPAPRSANTPLTPGFGAAYAATVPAEHARAAVAEELQRRAELARRAAEQGGGASAASAAAANAPFAAAPKASPDRLPTRSPVVWIVLAASVVLALLAYGLYAFVARSNAAHREGPDTGTATPSSDGSPARASGAVTAGNEAPRIVLPPAVAMPVGVDPTLAANRIDAGSASAPAAPSAMPVAPSDARDAGVPAAAVPAPAPAPVPAPAPEEHHHHGSTPTPTPTPSPTPAPAPTPAPDPWSSHGGTSTPAPEPSASSGARLLAEARASAGAGDARRCVELATEAIAAGVDSSVYRLRGDCYRMLGDTPHALRSYQRFCTLAPNSSQIGAVRSAAVALGGTCP